MGSFIYDMLKMIFGDGLSSSVSEMINNVFTTLQTIINNNSAMINWAMGVAATLMIIYFFQSVIDQTSRDMFTLDKLVVSFIKMIVAFSVMIYMPEILNMVLDLGAAFTNDINATITDTAGGAMAATFDKDEYVNYFKGINHAIAGIGAILQMIVPYVICMFCELLAKFIVISNGITLGVRMLFSPIAISQLFEDGSKSSGMRYLKGLIADAMAFSLIILLMYVANQFAFSVLGSSDLSGIDPGELNKHLGWDALVTSVITRLAVAGGMAGASKIAHDVMGA